MNMWAARADDGYVLGGLTKQCVDTLRGVPMLVESNDSRVRERLLPETYDGAEDEEHWREHATPELERLFMSRLQIVRKDLASLRQIEDADSWAIYLPDTHVNAWLASLNAARLSLYALNDLEPKHFERDGDVKCTQKQMEALWRIQFLAEIQCVLMGDIDDLESDEDEDDDSDEEGTEGEAESGGDDPLYDGPIPPVS
jgi:hypothetical protein